MKIFIGATEDKWFKFLQRQKPDEVNFWQPNSNQNFKAIQSGELFLFKLHSPNNYIVGGGVFVRQAMLPVSMTWDAFTVKNGTPRLDIRSSVKSLRRMFAMSILHHMSNINTQWNYLHD